MASLSHVVREPRRHSAVEAQPYAQPYAGERMRRGFGRNRAWIRAAPALRPRAATWAERFAPLTHTIERALRTGADHTLPLGTQKRIRLCNILTIGAGVIMAAWAYFEAAFGDRTVLPWELAFTAGFLAVLVLNASGAHRAARLLLILSANLCVLAGCVLFKDNAGGFLPFFAMAGMSLLLF